MLDWWELWQSYVRQYQSLLGEGLIKLQGEAKLTADMLKKIYDVRGSFYNLDHPSCAPLNCRNGLDIFTKNSYNQPLLETLPDALFVMMNPGSSRPWERDYEPPVYKVRQIVDKGEVPYVWTKAQPDITQYQIMRVMKHMGWSYVRVSNLSDIRCPKSLVFRDTLKARSGADPGQLHCIFSENRRQELEKVLQLRTGATIVVAWGEDKWLTELATKGIRSLPGEKLRGVQSGVSEVLYSHASPTLQRHKDRWLKGVLEAIRT